MKFYDAVRGERRVKDGSYSKTSRKLDCSGTIRTTWLRLVGIAQKSITGRRACQPTVERLCLKFILFLFRQRRWHTIAANESRAFMDQGIWHMTYPFQLTNAIQTILKYDDGHRDDIIQIVNHCYLAAAPAKSLRRFARCRWMCANKKHPNECQSHVTFHRRPHCNMQTINGMQKRFFDFHRVFRIRKTQSHYNSKERGKWKV